MRTIRSLGPQAALAVIVAILAVSCGTGHSSHRRGAHGSTIHRGGRSASATAPPAPALRAPFTIVARYSATSLGLTKPANLAVGADGNLYVTDASQRVTVISPHGRVLLRWGRSGTGPGQFSFVTHQAGVPGVKAAIAVGPDGRVYVADSGNARVEVFTPRGRFIRQFGSYGYGRGRFLFPDGVAVDRNGRVYVADDEQQTVSEFSANGAFGWQVGGNLARDADLVGHFHLSTVDAHGRIVIGNDDAERVLYVDARGDKVDAFGSAGDFRNGSCDVTVDSAGYTFVNSCQEPLLSPHYTEVFDRTHQLVATWYPSPLGWAPRFGPKAEVFALAENGSILRLRPTFPER